MSNDSPPPPAAPLSTAAPLAPRLALSLIGALALLVVGEIVAQVQGDRLCAETAGAVYQADARFGWRHVPGLAGWVRPCDTPSVPAVAVDVTSDGRLDFERPVAKPPGTVRILLLGGDAASVLGVRNPLGLQPTTLARLLEAHADRRHGAPLETIDATTGGWALDNDWLYLRHEGLRFGPDLVVVVADPATDVRALSPSLLAAAGRPVPAKPYLELAGEQLVTAAALPPAATSAPLERRGLLSHLQLYRIAAGLPSRSGPPVAELVPPAPASDTELEAERERARRLARRLLEEMRDGAASAGGRLVLALASTGEDPVAQEDGRRLREDAASLGIPTLDLATPLRGFEALSGRPTSFAGTREWNADGHFVAAKALWSFLTREGLLPKAIAAAPALNAGQVRDPATFPTAIVDAFRRDRHTLLSSLLQFGALAVCVIWIAAALPIAVRDWVVVALDVVLLVVLSTPLFAAETLLFAALLFVALERLPQRAAAAAATGLLAGFVVLPVLPTPGFLPALEGEPREFMGLATNVAFLRFAAHAHDRLRARRAGSDRAGALREYLAAMLFFPTFVDGPIQSSEQFLASRPAAGLAPESFAALRRHLVASARALVRALAAMAAAYASYVLLNHQLRLDVFATGGAAVSRARLWLWTGELYFLFYFAFAAWSAVAISLGRMAGTAVPENFRHPWLATDVADFWRRWHITFGTWLRTFVYLPLGGGRRHVALNILVVFVVSALWHVWGALKLVGLQGYPAPAWSGFLLWGGLNALAVAGAHAWHRHVKSRAAIAPSGDLVPPRGRVRAHLGRLARQVATFVFVSLAWVPFFMPPDGDLDKCLAVFARLFFLR